MMYSKTNSNVACPFNTNNLPVCNRQCARMPMQNNVRHGQLPANAKTTLSTWWTTAREAAMPAVSETSCLLQGSTGKLRGIPTCKGLKLGKTMNRIFHNQCLLNKNIEELCVICWEVWDWVTMSDYGGPMRRDGQKINYLKEGQA